MYGIDGMEQPGHARRGRRGRTGRQVQRESPSFPFKFDYPFQSWILGWGSVVSFCEEVQAADTHHLSLLPRSILLLRDIGSYTSPSSCGNAREQIRSLPTVMAFKDGQPISQFSESHAPTLALDFPFLSRWVSYVVTQLDASTLTMLFDFCQMLKFSSLQWVRSQRNRSRCSSIASRKSKNGRYYAL
jgi:hypothetical protein